MKGSQRQVTTSTSGGGEETGSETKRARTEDASSGSNWDFISSNEVSVCTSALSSSRNWGQAFLDFCDKQGGANHKRFGEQV